MQLLNNRESRDVTEFKEKVNQLIQHLLDPLEKELLEICSGRMSIASINKQDSNGNSVLHRAMQEITNAITSVNMYGGGYHHYIPNTISGAMSQLVRCGGDMCLENKAKITPLDILVTEIKHLKERSQHSDHDGYVRLYESIYQEENYKDKVQTLGRFLCMLLTQRKCKFLKKKCKRILAENLPDEVYQKLPCDCKLPVSAHCNVKTVVCCMPNHERVLA